MLLCHLNDVVPPGIFLSLIHAFLSQGGHGQRAGDIGVFCYFQGKQGCTGIQRAWLRLICLETFCSHIHSPVPHRPRQESLCAYIAGIHLAGEANYTCLLGNLSMSVISTPSPFPLGLLTLSKDKFLVLKYPQYYLTLIPPN